MYSVSYPESSGFLVSGGRRERLWGNGILTAEIPGLPVLLLWTATESLPTTTHADHVCVANEKIKNEDNNR